ncbi:MAG: MFS transporter, partial [Planctomycetota bacterium]
MDSAVLDAARRTAGQRAALRTNMFAIVTQFIVAGPIMVLFANDVLRFEPATIGALLGLLPLVGLIRLPLLGWLGRFRRRRLLIATDCLRLGMVLLLLVLPLATLQSAWFYAGLLVLFTALQQIGMGTVWQPLMRDITTSQDRGRFFARMRFVFTFVNACTTGLIAAVVGDQIDLDTYRVLLVGVLLAIANHLFWARRIPARDDVPEDGHSQEGEDRPTTWQVLRESRLLRRPLLIAVLFALGNLPLVVVYLRQGL